MDANHEKPAIKGKHIAITGILAFYKRQDAFDQIEACGGFSQNNVTYNTDYLVVGYYRRNSIHGEKSNMTRLAEKYNRQGKKIAIIREDEFLTTARGRRSRSSERMNSLECCGRHRNGLVIR